MKVAIVYCSQTGFTKKYADWLAEDLESEAVPYADRGRADLGDADILVFCSWLHAASIKGAKWLKRAMGEHPNLDVVVLVTGAMPVPCKMQPASEFEDAFRRTFSESEHPDLPHFYCRGGFDYDRLSTPDKMAMRMFFKMNAKAAETDPKAAEMLRVMKDGFDGTRRDHLEPVLSCIQHLQAKERK